MFMVITNYVAMPINFFLYFDINEGDKISCSSKLCMKKSFKTSRPDLSFLVNMVN